MKITKYEHACVVIEEQGKKIVIDPGIFTTSLSDLSNICGIVVTHVHPDHFNVEMIDKIQAENPQAAVYTVQQVADELGDRPHEVVSGNVSDLCDIFHLSFFGGQHAIIHESMPVWQNVGVLVNEKFYYPGDSYDIPEGREIHALAVPSIAPWMKISEAMDFITAVKAKQIFPTHNAMLSDIGHQIYNPRLEASAQEAGGTFRFLKPGESLDI